MMKKIWLSLLMLGSLLSFSGCELMQSTKPEWIVGEVAPSDEGKDGDFYYDKIEKKIYYKENGVWVEQGVVGPQETTKTEITNVEGEYLFNDALFNTKNANEMTSVYNGTDIEVNNIKMVFLGDQIYYEADTAIEYYEFDSISNEIVAYRQTKDTGIKSVYTRGGYSSLKEYYHHHNNILRKCLNLSNFKALMQEEAVSLINSYMELNLTLEDIIASETYSVIDDKYLVILNYKYQTSIIDFSLSISFKFKDKIEQMRTNITYYSIEGEVRTTVLEEDVVVEYSYEADESLRCDDFSDYDELKGKALINNAISETRQVEEMGVIMPFEAIFFGDQIYIGNQSDKRYIVYDDNLDKYIGYDIDTNTGVKNSQFVEVPSDIHSLKDYFYYNATFLWEAVNIDSLMTRHKREILERWHAVYEINYNVLDDIIVNQAYSGVNDKYLVTINYKYETDTLDLNYTLILEYSDKIEKIKMDIKEYSIEGQDKSLISENINEIVYFYEVDTSLRCDDFSDFPEPSED